MLNRNTLRRPLPVIAAGVLAVALIGGGTAAAANFVTSKDVKNDSLRSVDVKNGSLRVKDLTDAAVDTLQKPGPQGATGATGAQGPKGDTGAQGPKGDTGPSGKDGKDATYVGANWSIVDRNVIGNGDSFLRAGPDGAPFGVGSLGIRTGSSADAANFGNQLDFQGDLVADLYQVGYWVFTTGENRSISPTNLPNVKFEIDPNLTTSNFSTMVFVPNATPAGWTEIDATDPAAGYWYLTGQGGTDSGCSHATSCTFEEVKAKLPAATIYTVQVGKGRDNAFSGAVDGLGVNNAVYDFEPFGVHTLAP
jgi:hypothetical protein